MSGGVRDPRPGRGLPRTLAPLLLGVLCLAGAPDSLSGQGLRGWVGTTVQMVELRPFGQDTVGRYGVVTDSLGRMWDGTRQVSCFAGDFCTAYVPLEKDQLVAATQDVSFTAWGFGLEGLSFTALLRGRAHAGSDLLWPRSDDAFAAMLGYAQLQRGSYRFRLGRQEVRSGLGFPSFDGGSGTYATGTTQVEAYGGRSLARGLREPANEALKGIEDWFVDEGARLWGASLRKRVEGAVFTARYHREILADRSGLVGERGSVDVVTSIPHLRLTGSADYDFGRDRLGKSHLTVGLPLREGRVLVEATARRYVPYFQLSTIWGFFEPGSYSELELRGSWSAAATLGLWASGGRRSYGDTDTQVLSPLTETGWRANAGARWQVRPGWTVDGSYRLEWGPGAFLSSGDVALRYTAWERLALSVTGTSFQQIEEFRVGDGRALGGGMSFDLKVTDRASFAGGMSMLRHRDGGSVFTSPWNQTRGWTSLRIDIGEDPGLANRRRVR
ncbi:MAG: hypothetical protein FIA95_11115 [Gemmatimonadetes bacterium]|nr:hypothetical protein [Gemmatimonadota bacterium]